MLGQLLSAWLKGQGIVKLTFMDLEFAVESYVVKLAIFFGLGRLKADLEELSLIMIVALDTKIVRLFT